MYQWFLRLSRVNLLYVIRYDIVRATKYLLHNAALELVAATLNGLQPSWPLHCMAICRTTFLFQLPGSCQNATISGWPSNGTSNRVTSRSVLSWTLSGPISHFDEKGRCNYTVDLSCYKLDSITSYLIIQELYYSSHCLTLRIQNKQRHTKYCNCHCQRVENQTISFLLRKLVAKS